MEKLLKLASEAFEQADVYYEEETNDDISFIDGKLEKADSSLSSGIALRVIKDGKTGLAHTRNLLDRDALVEQAKLSAQNGMAVNIRLPHTVSVPQLDTYSTGIEKLTKQELITVGKDMLAYIKQRTDAQTNISFEYSTSLSGLMNSAGTDLRRKHSSFAVFAQLVFPGTGSGLYQFRVGKGFVDLGKEVLDEMIDLFLLSSNQIVPPTAKLPVIFMPTCMYAFLQRLYAAMAPVNIYNKVSPLCNRTGDKIVSDKFSLWQDPLDPELNSSTAFDDEGTPTRKYAFIENGVFKAIPTDLNYAQKLSLQPTGNGFRGSVEAMANAYPINTCIGTGDKTLKEMIASIDKGLLVHQLMGAHSGNVLNGDYSVGVSVGFYIENGVVIGRVKDCMLSGNAYESLSNIVSIENKHYNTGSSKLPAIMLDGISVAGK